MDTFENQEQKLGKILDRVKIETGISGLADELKEEIREDVNSRIERRVKTKVIYFRALAAVACVAIALFMGIYLSLNNNSASRKKQMLAQLEMVSTMDEMTEVSIVSGKIRKTVAANEEIINTEEGDVFIGEIQEIRADDLEEEYLTIVVPKGKRTSVLLCDHTKIWVNSGSRLVYPKKFKGKSRNVCLKGEIYIEVSRNEEMPFCVHAGRMDVNVLGTKFNVNAYEDEPVSYVVLAEGSVEVEKGKKKNRLTPGHGYFVSEDAEWMKKIDIYAYTCWKDGRMKLVDEPFDNLIRKLSRYYGVDIVADTTLNFMRFDGNLNLTDSVEEVISTLSLSRNLSYRKAGNVIEIRSHNMKTD